MTRSIPDSFIHRFHPRAVPSAIRSWSLIAGALVFGGLIPGTPAVAAPDAGTSPAPGTCVPATDILCLQADRFQVEVDWTAPDTSAGRGQAAPLSTSTGTFTFDDPRYLELFVSVLDGCGANGNFWVEATGLSDWEVDLTITDLDLGTMRTYSSAAGGFLNVQDLGALPCDPMPNEATPDESTLTDRAEKTRGADPGPPLSLAGGRLQARVEWRDFAGNPGTGRPIPIRSHGGLFYFFAPSDISIGLKTFDGRADNGFFQVTYGGAVNVAFDLEITDICTGAVRSYSNPAGQSAAPVRDLAAFPVAPDCLIFGDGFEFGDTAAWTGTP